MERKKSLLKFLILMLFILILPAFALSGCGGGGGGSSSAPTSPTTPTTPTTPTPTPGTSSSSESGAIGVAVVSGVTEVAAPSTSSNGAGYLTSLPNSGTLTGTLIGATVSSAQFQPISVPAITTTVNGTNLDCAHSVGAAFSYYSPVVAFFGFPSCTESTSTLSQVGFYTTTSANSLNFSGASGVDIGGVVLDSTNQWAIVSTGDGFQIISYSTPSAPVFVKTIPSLAYTQSLATPNNNGIDMAENFAYDSNFNVSGVTDPMILSGVGGEASPTDNNSLELADAKTGIIYKPDATTAGYFNAAGIAAGGSASCNTDQIGVDTSYQVAVLGCEFDPFAMIVNLNAMTLSAPTTAGGDGTYTLPASAIMTIATGTGATANSLLDNALVESSTHTVFLGSGGYGYPTNEFMVGVLSNPTTKFGFTTPMTMVTMPLTSSSNVANCTYTGCTPISLESPWGGAYDPHANAAYANASGDAMVLWMNSSWNYMAVINLTTVLTDPSSPPAASIWYQGIP